jgi:hypothetical protein
MGMTAGSRGRDASGAEKDGRTEGKWTDRRAQSGRLGPSLGERDKGL